MKVVGIRFRQAGKIYTFDSCDYDIKPGDAVIVETIRGKEMGFCAKMTTEVPDGEETFNLKPVIRVATEEDKERYRENIIKATEAFKECKELIKKHDLPMKLTDCNYTFDNHKLLFYFTADDRVDFRELVKDLAYLYKTRIELRQIGVRDEAKILGGIGQCGRELCCKSWMSNFNNVTIKMAKDQNIALTPSRISGMCGRLLCCLNYEQEFYQEKISEMPKIRSRVMTPKGPGTVIYVNVLTEEITVSLESDDGSYSQQVFKLSDEIYEEKASDRKSGCNCPNKKVNEIDIDEELKNEEEEFGEIVVEEDFTESLEDEEAGDKQDNKKLDKNKKFDKNKKYDKNNRNDKKPRDKKPYKKKSFKQNEDGKKGAPRDKNKNFENKRGSYKKDNHRGQGEDRRSKRLIDREKRAKEQRIQNEGDDSL